MRWQSGAFAAFPQLTGKLLLLLRAELGNEKAPARRGERAETRGDKTRGAAKNKQKHRKQERGERDSSEAHPDQRSRG